MARGDSSSKRAQSPPEAHDDLGCLGTRGMCSARCAPTASQSRQPQIRRCGLGRALWGQLEGKSEISQDCLENPEGSGAGLQRPLGSNVVEQSQKLGSAIFSCVGSSKAPSGVKHVAQGLAHNYPQ